MNPNKRAWLVLAAFILVFMIIACSCGSLKPASGTVPETSTSNKGIQTDTGGSSPTDTITASESENSTGASSPTDTITASVSENSTEAPSIEQVPSQISIPAGKSGSASVPCPEGSLRLGGGFAAESGMKITKSIPDTSGWLVSGTNSTASPLPLNVYAVCLHNPSGTTKIVSAQVPVSGAPFARCQKGDLITGGGYSDETGSLDVNISTPIGDSVDHNNAWSVMAKSSQNVDQPITVYAVCLSQSKLQSSLLRDEKVAYGKGNDALRFTYTCQGNSMMVSGGYEGTGAYTSRINPKNASQWEVQVQGKFYYDGSLDHAVCLSLP